MKPQPAMGSLHRVLEGSAILPIRPCVSLLPRPTSTVAIFPIATFQFFHQIPTDLMEIMTA
jgi:hypothetical protein